MIAPYFRPLLSKMNKTNYLVLISLLATLCGPGCRKTDIPAGEMPDGKIALSFDDTSIDNWYKYLPLLDSLNIKATFYISAYHTLKPEQVARLRILQAHGNEIAYHTTNHGDLLKMYSRNSMWYVLENEIKPDLKLMQNDGFKPENFAYPYGQHDAYLDRQMLVFFKSVRAVSTPKYYNKSFLKGPCTGEVFHAANIDETSKITEEQIEKMMAQAHDNQDCVLFYAHMINHPASKYYITTDRLRYLGSLAKKYNLEFIPTSDITK
jgi:peptidoglycan-N-acetylglucosamine deacetylase